MIAKRIFDLFFVIPGFIILFPACVFVALWIKADSSGPVFFRQERIGMGGKPFRIFKFRTMVINAENLGAKVTAGCDPRITTIGNFLRKYKLDELPQLINVLKGEMSLVGPRPEVAEYVEHWPEDMRDLVLSVPPGITDFASIEFRDESDMLQGASNHVEKYINEIIPIKLDYYARYVRERNLLLDLRLIVKTISSVFR